MASVDKHSAVPPKPEQNTSEILTKVLALAAQFSTCVEAFNLIHPHNESERPQQLALTRLGLEQGRLLILGDVLGISSPPSTIATHMIPSHPGATNPDPTEAINFGPRDPRLDDARMHSKVEEVLTTMTERPALLSREELMEKHGLKAPKKFKPTVRRALDTNRLEAFREKYALLQDLARQSGVSAGMRRAPSLTMTHWTVRDVHRFDTFICMVKKEVDSLIELFGVAEKVAIGVRVDLRSLGWHPDLTGSMVRLDWEKLKLIREAVADEYPEFSQVADTAMKFISEELKATRQTPFKVAYEPPRPMRKASQDDKTIPNVSTLAIKSPASPAKEKRPGFLSAFRKSWTRSSKDSRKSKASTAPNQAYADPQRSLSVDVPRNSEDDNALTQARSKSVGAMPEQLQLDLDSRLKGDIRQSGKDAEATLTTQDTPSSALEREEFYEYNPLAIADTHHSLIDRHDMYRGVGRIETRDIREKSKEAAGAYV